VSGVRIISTEVHRNLKYIPWHQKFNQVRLCSTQLVFLPLTLIASPPPLRCPYHHNPSAMTATSSARMNSDENEIHVEHEREPEHGENGNDYAEYSFGTGFDNMNDIEMQGINSKRDGKLHEEAEVTNEGLPVKPKDKTRKGIFLRRHIQMMAISNLFFIDCAEYYVFPSERSFSTTAGPIMQKRDLSP